jgi:hypothetical protein
MESETNSDPQAEENFLKSYLRRCNWCKCEFDRDGIAFHTEGAQNMRARFRNFEQNCAPQKSPIGMLKNK